MPVIQYSDNSFEFFDNDSTLGLDMSERYSNLARLVIDRRGPEVLKYADKCGINLNDPVDMYNVLVSIRAENERKQVEYERLSREATYIA